MVSRLILGICLYGVWVPRLLGYSVAVTERILQRFDDVKRA